MYIRAKSRTLKSRDSAETFSLVESYRIHGSARQRMLLNLGQGSEIPEEPSREQSQRDKDDLLEIQQLPFESEKSSKRLGRNVQKIKTKRMIKKDEEM